MKKKIIVIAILILLLFLFYKIIDSATFQSPTSPKEWTVIRGKVYDCVSNELLDSVTITILDGIEGQTHYDTTIAQSNDGFYYADFLGGEYMLHPRIGRQAYLNTGCQDSLKGPIEIRTDTAVEIHVDLYLRPEMYLNN